MRKSTISQPPITNAPAPAMRQLCTFSDLGGLRVDPHLCVDGVRLAMRAAGHPSMLPSGGRA